MPRQKRVQAVRECLSIALTERGWSAGHDTAAAQLVHEIAHRQALANVLLRAHDRIAEPVAGSLMAE
jgi:hypothetical protein